MKRSLLLLVALLAFLEAFAQNISVKSFKALPTDLTASSKDCKRIDQNGAVAALIKVVTTEKGFTFEAGALGIVDVRQEAGEIWVWVPRSSRKITVKHPVLGVLRDYFYPMDIESERTYEMVLVTAKMDYVVTEPEPIKGSLFVESEPMNCKVYIDGKYVGKTPFSLNEIGVGQHRLLLVLKGYSDFTDVFDITLEEPCKIKANLTVDPDAEKRLFSVSLEKKVRFAPGNLQYQASTNTWRFAEHQWDYVGERNNEASPGSGAWIDLFGWGTSGYRNGAIAYQPWSKSSKESDYCPYGLYINNLNNQTGKADWGYNRIINGKEAENQWRTLTSSEWSYLFNKRVTESGVGYAKGNVAGVNGVILFPDDWKEDFYPIQNPNKPQAEYGSNVITAEQWSVLEQQGAVFLPAAGKRNSQAVNGLGVAGEYWSATAAGEISANCLIFDPNGLYPVSSDYRSYGKSVRLVNIN